MNRTTIFSNFLWVQRMIFTEDKKFVIVSIFMALTNGIFDPLLLLIMRNMINIIQIEKTFTNELLQLLTFYVIAQLLYSFFNIYVNYYNMKFSKNFSLSLELDILDKIPKISLKNFEDSHTYDVINRAQLQGGDELLTYYNLFISSFSEIITVISYIFIIKKLNIYIAIVILGIPLIKFYFDNKYNFKLFNLSRYRVNKSRKTWYINYLITYGNSYKELKIFDLFGHLTNNYKEYKDSFNNEDLKVIKSSSFFYFLISIIEGLFSGFIFGYIIYLSFFGKILIGDIVTYFETVINGKEVFSSLLNNFSQIYKDSLFIDQIKEFFNLKNEIDGNIEIKEIKSIEFKNVSYKYNNNSYVLKNINFTIKKSEKIAILGINGSGKTTLLKLLMGFYMDYQGEIFINGIDLKYINRKSYQRRISALFQDFIKYESTIRKNMSLSNLNKMYDDRFLYDVADKFGLYHIILGKNHRLDTELGNWFGERKQSFNWTMAKNCFSKNIFERCGSFYFRWA